MEENEGYSRCHGCGEWNDYCLGNTDGCHPPADEGLDMLDDYYEGE